MKDASANAEGKRAAGLAAAALVENGQWVGLGTGSTAAFAISELGRRVQEEGLQIQCVATSLQSRNLALESGLRVMPLDRVARIDLSIDGADEIDPQLNLIKGGGAAHTIEKLVHSMADRFIVVADPSKLSPRLGDRFAVPVEALPSACAFVIRRLEQLGAAEIKLRHGSGKDGPVITDNGNLVLDARFQIEDPLQLERSIKSIPGVVESGIFAARKPRSGDCLIGEEGGVRQLQSV
ncbi:MAG: ribose-5-phosphate isomerase RpiA [Leptospirales bacterium]|nr:ribose-5-phosphate isomerase RpiA [Leptospirales bacterium]